MIMKFLIRIARLQQLFFNLLFRYYVIGGIMLFPLLFFLSNLRCSCGSVSFVTVLVAFIAAML